MEDVKVSDPTTNSNCPNKIPLNLIEMYCDGQHELAGGEGTVTSSQKNLIGELYWLSTIMVILGLSPESLTSIPNVLTYDPLCTLKWLIVLFPKLHCSYKPLIVHITGVPTGP